MIVEDDCDQPFFLAYELDRTPSSDFCQLFVRYSLPWGAKRFCAGPTGTIRVGLMSS
jgi:hypothetical protein